MQPFQKIAKLILLILTLDLPTLYSSAQEVTTTTTTITVPFQVFLVKKDPQDVVSAECTPDEKNFLTNALRTVIPEAVKAVKAIGVVQLSLTSNLTEVSVNSSKISVDINLQEVNVGNIPTMRPTTQPRMRPNKLVTKFPTIRPTVSSTNLPTLPPTRIPTGRPTSSTMNVPTNFPTYTPTIPSTRRKLIRSKQVVSAEDQHTRRLAVAQFVWGGSSSWTCRGCGPDMSDYNIYVPGEDVILDLIYGIRGPTLTERTVTTNITVVMQQEIDTRLKDPSITVGCLQNSIFSTYYKDLSIAQVFTP